MQRYISQPGANLSATDANGNSALHLAVTTQRYEIVNILVTHGINLNIKNQDGNTALHVASIYLHTFLMKVLVDANADLNAINNRKRTALIEAAIRNYGRQAVEILIDAKANLDIVDEDGNTALHWAFLEKHHEAAKLLIHAGADITIPNKKGETPKILAKATGDIIIKEIIKDASASARLKEFWEARDKQLTQFDKSLTLEEQVEKQENIAHELAQLSLQSILNDIRFIQDHLYLIRELHALPTILLEFSNLITLLGGPVDLETKEIFAKLSHDLRSVAAQLGNESATHIIENFDPALLESNIDPEATTEQTKTKESVSVIPFSLTTTPGFSSAIKGKEPKNAATYSFGYQ